MLIFVFKYWFDAIFLLWRCWVASRENQLLFTEEFWKIVDIFCLVFNYWLEYAITYWKGIWSINRVIALKNQLYFHWRTLEVGLQEIVLDKFLYCFQIILILERYLFLKQGSMERPEKANAEKNAGTRVWIWLPNSTAVNNYRRFHHNFAMSV